MPNAWQNNHRHHVNEYLKAHTCEQLNPFPTEWMFGAVLRKLTPGPIVQFCPVNRYDCAMYDRECTKEGARWST